MCTDGESRRLARWVHRTLLIGLVLSGCLVGVGLALALLLGQPRPVGPPPSAPVLLRRAAGGDGTAWMELGLLALMFTPVLRVAVLAVGWWLAGEKRFSAVALVVLGLLGLSLALGVG
jgi:uncharacterized membrane protein